MTNFFGNPKTQKLEAVDGDPGTGLYSYRYDERNVRKSDIKQILRITELILGTNENTKIMIDPDDHTIGTIFLCVKNRSNIELGKFQF